MDLLERDEHISLLVRAMSAAAGGAGSVVLVTGEAGVGKSSLVEAFLNQLPSHVRVLRGTCDDLLAPPSLGPFREAVSGTDGPLEHALASDRLDETIAALALEFRDRTTVLVIEDVHWADDATLDLLRYLARRAFRYPVLVLLTCRDGEVDSQHRLRQLLSTLATVPTLRLALEPLTASAVARLSTDSGWDPAELHRITGGNPFYVVEALAGPHGVSASVADAVLSRVRSLEVSTIAAIEQLSVVPNDMDLSFASSLVGDAYSALVEAEARGILVVRGQQVGFRHEIARRAIAASMTSIQRRTMNQNVVRTLLTVDSPSLSSLVHHAFEAGDVDVLLRYAPLLARAATNSGAHRQALASFEAVLPHAGRLPLVERALLYENYAWELQLGSRFADAVQVGREAVELRRQEGDAPALAEAQTRQARLLLMAGDVGAARELVERAVATAGPAASESLQAAVNSVRGAAMIYAGKMVEGVQVLQRALDHAVASERLKLVPFCLAYTGVARCVLGETEGLADVRAAIVSARAVDPGTASFCQYILVDLLYRMHRWDELAEEVSAGLEWSSSQGHWSMVHGVEILRATLDLRHGDWAMADRRLRQLIEAVDEPGLLAAQAYPLLGRLLARRGHPDAFAFIQAAWNRAIAGKPLLTVIDAGTAFAEWAWLNDRRDLAADVRDLVLRQFPAVRGPLFGELRSYLHRAGTPLDAEVPRSAVLFEPIADGLTGDWESAAAGWRKAGDNYEAALELASSGRVGPMTEALEILEKLGADGVAARLRHELRNRGVRLAPRPSPRSPGTANPAGLSDRQLEVLAHLSEGLTNREIADRLVVSVRTVDHHVAAILAKLGAVNRREATTIARSWQLDAKPSEGPSRNP
ncbi:ATP-binding protein [Kribbella sp. CA-253562]|uniref:ATP-binding protein n=1 Tax=Kribbella sp. CA-253562 TaxID=3239942 RepID=UPI003D8B51F6